MPIARPALRISRLSALIAAGAVTAFLLAGCAGADVAKSGATNPGSTPGTGTGAASAAPSASATFTPTPEPSPIPVTLTQAQVWTAQQVYTFNPNFTTDPNYKLQSSSPAAQLVQLKGVSYGWVNETSKDQIEVAVAHPNPANFAQFDGAVASSSGEQQVPIDGAPSGTVSYFAIKDGVGSLQIFTNNGYWVVIDSKTFMEPGDAYPIATDVMGNLR